MISLLAAAPRGPLPAPAPMRCTGTFDPPAAPLRRRFFTPAQP